MKYILTIITLFLFSFSSNAQNNTQGITVEEEIEKVNCRNSHTGTRVYLNIKTKYEYTDFNSKIRIESLDDNGKYRWVTSKLIKGNNYEHDCGGLKFGTHTYRFYQYPDTGEYRNFKKVPENSWVEKTFQVTKKCK